jgi:hypothetical protein
MKLTIWLFISFSNVMLVRRGALPLTCRFEWEKGKVQGKADWPVRRCGVYDGLRVVVSPVFPGAWAWETNEW